MSVYLTTPIDYCWFLRQVDREEQQLCIARERWQEALAAIALGHQLVEFTARDVLDESSSLPGVADQTCLLRGTVDLLGLAARGLSVATNR